MPDKLSAEATARRKAGRRRTGPVNDATPTTLLALMSAAAFGVAGIVWYLKGGTQTPPLPIAATSAAPAIPSVPPPTPWVDLAQGDGPLPLPPEDRTLNMVLIPAGKFLYGEDNDEFELSAFFIDRCEVSQAQYAQFLRYVRQTGDHSHCRPDEPPDKDHTPLNWGRPDITDPRYPVVGIDYWDVWAYAGWVGKRLPTEQEWEKAARGADGRTYPWGEQWDDRLCNWGPTPGNHRTLLPVDSMTEGQSPYGCLHMLGNAAEWTASFIDETRRVHCGRGYCWRIGDKIPFLATYRMPGPTSLRDEGSGMRCALDAPGDTADECSGTKTAP